MKLVSAIIQPDKVDAVRESLVAADIKRITVSRCTGHGQATNEEIYRGQSVAPNLNAKVRLDIAVNDDFVKPTIDAIMRAAKHGEEGAIGDGKIFVTALEQCIRIRTGESGSDAI